MARSVDDLTLALRVLTTLEDNEIDPQIAPVPLGDPAQVRVAGLRIGMWHDDGFFPASSALRRAVDEAADALRCQAAHVEPFDPPEARDMVDLFFGLVSADGGADAVRLLASGPRDWRINRLVRLGGMPTGLRTALGWSLRLAGQRRTADLIAAIGGRSADGYWKLSAARAAYADRFFQRWSAARLDAMICPPHALPALLHGSTAHLAIAGSYCYWANVLGVPAGVVPVTTVRPAEQHERTAGRDAVERAAAAVDAGSAGLPVGVQVAGRPWREDVVLAVMGALEAALRPRSDFPQTPVTPR